MIESFPQPVFFEKFIGYIGAQIYVIVDPQYLELSNVKHLMSERVQNFMLALYPCLLVTLN